MRGLCTKLLTSVDENAVGVTEKPLTFRRKLHKLSCFSTIAPSSNGKTADSGSAYRGSNPCGAAEHCGLRIADCLEHTPKLAFRGPESETGT